jgi:hypothetical protein
VLKLVYHAGVFGPIHLEYGRPVIRVGRSDDNDLVLRHPSVEPHHCLLAFRDEKVVCLPPDAALSPEVDLRALAGPEFGVGEQIIIGELQFSLVHSARTVAIPAVDGRDSGAQAVADEAATGAGRGGDQRHYFCAHCQRSFPNAEVKRVGLVGHAKRYLCPKCSRLLDVETEPPKPPPGRKRRS